MKGRWVVFSIPLLLFIGMAYFLATGLENDPKKLPSMALDKPLPPFQLSSLQDPQTLITEKDLEGPALVNVWATWCPSCRIEHPVLNSLSQAGIPIYGIDHTDEREAAKAYLNLHGNPYRLVIFDENGELGLDLGITGAPETFMIDADGVVRYHHVGVVDERAWRDVLWPKWRAIGGFDPTSQQQPSGKSES
ncbi:MAG: DsbE family thiol:disulfide interchange protein [Ketobacteraceae bacterium]|nr:DsbE family thiol:disulfide interchange protein [Ketobacteraceae bacterium]